MWLVLVGRLGKVFIVGMVVVFMVFFIVLFMIVWFFFLFFEVGGIDVFGVLIMLLIGFGGGFC